MAEEYIKKSDIQYGYYPIATILKGGSIVWRHIAFMSEIDAMRPADVVKVVRCKDCKWFGEIGCAIKVVDETDMPKENDFCSFAERKTMRLIDADALWKEFCRSEAIEERYGSGVLEIAGNIIDNAPTVDAVPHWIPCEERLPDIGDTYIVSGKMKYSFDAEYEFFVDAADYVPYDEPHSYKLGNKFYNYRFHTWNDWYEGQDEYEILAWMPLPEPYKEEQDG